VGSQQEQLAVKGLWKFIRDPKNLAVLVALGGVCAFLWIQIIAPQLESPPTPTPPARVQEAKGGTAINASGTAQVSIGAGASPASTAAPPPCPTELATEQKANAGETGIAVNAGCGARVQINDVPRPRP
jgi:hypothetical protein